MVTTPLISDLHSELGGRGATHPGEGRENDYANVSCDPESWDTWGGAGLSV